MAQWSYAALQDSGEPATNPPPAAPGDPTPTAPGPVVPGPAAPDASTPPPARFNTAVMGWNTWNTFTCNVSETLVKETADTLVSSGMRDAGYRYVSIDDCWMQGRDANGAVVVNPATFPSGMKALADYVHGKGLKLGIYSTNYTLTCAGRSTKTPRPRLVGSLGHEAQDAATYASWGIDYLKYDNCYNDGNSGTPQISATRYKAMGNALNATGRPMLYSMCNWGEDYPWAWAQTVANSWRMSGPCST
jgi:alpha-galactosidase